MLEKDFRTAYKRKGLHLRFLIELQNVTIYRLQRGAGGGGWLIFEWAYIRMYGPITGGWVL